MTSTDLDPVAGAQAGTRVLDATQVTMRFGGLVAVNAVDFHVDAGEIVGLIGPNGAGKTTFFNCLTGLYAPTAGRVQLNGTPLPPKPRKVVQAGMARTFQNIRLFNNMTVEENVMVGQYCRTSAGPFTSIIRGRKYRVEERRTHERAQELLDFIGMGDKGHGLARNLPYGDQRKLEIARAMATDPSVLLLDEPTAGMNPQETRQTEQLIKRIRSLGLSIVVIEHDMRFIFNLCDRVVCLAQGAVLSEGSAEQVQSDPRVIEAYIGTGPEESATDEPGVPSGSVAEQEEA